MIINYNMVRSVVLAPENDLYFPKEDNEDEVKLMRDAKLVIIPGVWGHFAGGGINPDDTNLIDNQIKQLLLDA